MEQLPRRGRKALTSEYVTKAVDQKCLDKSKITLLGVSYFETRLIRCSSRVVHGVHFIGLLLFKILPVRSCFCQQTVPMMEDPLAGVSVQEH